MIQSKRIGRVLGVLAVLSFLGFGVSASAQTPPESSTNASARAGQFRNSNTPSQSMTSTPVAASIYANPYMNPFLNPLAAQGQYSRQELAMYMWSAQQQAVGIGTGRLSGSRGDSRNMNGKPERPVADPLPARTPGGSAANYFQRGAAAPREARFQRAGTHFFSNGH